MLPPPPVAPFSMGKISPARSEISAGSIHESGEPITDLLYLFEFHPSLELHRQLIEG